MAQANPYHSPRSAESVQRGSSGLRPWLGCAVSVAASLLSLVLFYLYFHWHWYKGPWTETLPGQLGLSWVTAVDGSKACSFVLAIASLVVTIWLFRRRGYLQTAISMPTCLLSLLTVPIIT